MTNAVENTNVTTEVSATAPVAATKAEKPAKEVKEKAPSTKSKVVPVVTAAIAAGTARKDTLAKLQADFGISAACANTYYQNVKSGNWK